MSVDISNITTRHPSGEMYDCYSEVSASQLKLDPFKEAGAVDNMDTNRKMANSASEEFEKLYKVIINNYVGSSIICILGKNQIDFLLHPAFGF